MLDLSHCRRVLGASAPEDDKTLESIRDDAYALADIITDAFFEERLLLDDPSMDNRHLERALSLYPEIAREGIQERAAIQEYDGGMERGEAERSAIEMHKSALLRGIGTVSYTHLRAHET